MVFSPSIELHYQTEMDLQFALGRRAEYRFSQSVICPLVFAIRAHAMAEFVR